MGSVVGVAVGVSAVQTKCCVDLHICPRPFNIRSSLHTLHLHDSQTEEDKLYSTYVHMCSYLRSKHINYLNKLIEQLYRPILDCDGTVNIVRHRESNNGSRKRSTVSATRVRVK